MKTSDFYYDLPQELIAQTPLQRRDGSRLMTLERNSGAIGHHYFYELPDFLRKGDCLVLNNSRVLPARLIGRRETGGAAEILLLTDRGDNVWECLVRPGKKLRAGARVIFGSGQLEAQIQEVLPDGNRLVRFQYEGIFLEILEQLGKMPLPPYIKEELSDGERYQTVYSKVVGSGSGAYCRPAFHTGTVGSSAEKRGSAGLCYPSCGTGDLPSGQRGRAGNP